MGIYLVGLQQAQSGCPASPLLDANSHSEAVSTLVDALPAQVLHLHRPTQALSPL